MTGTTHTRISSLRSTIGMAFAGFALIVTACSSSGETSVAAADSTTPAAAASEPSSSTTTSEPTSTTAVETTSTTTATPVDLDEWAAGTTGALRTLHNAQRDAYLDYLDTDDGEAPGYNDEIESVEADAASYRELARVTEQIPLGTELESSATAFHIAVVDMADAFEAVATKLAEDYSIRNEYDYDVARGVEPQTFFWVFEPLAAPREQFQLTCFSLQAEMTDRDLPLLDCANSGQDDPTFDDGDGSVGSVQVGAGDLSAGVTYEFAEFTRPVTIVPGEALRSESSGDLMYLFVPGEHGPPGASVFFLGMDEILDPTAPRSPNPVESTVPMPANFGDWLSSSGLTVIAEGTSLAGELEVPWWEFEQVPSGTPTDPISIASSDNRDVNGGNVQVFASPTIVWQVQHPAGPLLVVTDPFWENPTTTRNEAFAFVESLLATMKIPTGG